MRIASIVALCLMVVAAPAQDVPNPGFEDGAAGDPDGWSLNQGTGAWEMDGRDGGRCISVTGGGDNEASNFWLTDDLVFKPGETYRISLWMKVALGTSGGTIMTGPSFANRDYGCGETWEEKSFVFAVPEEPGNSGYLRFGQWEKGGTVYFDDIGLTKVQPIHATTGDIELGAGETIEGGRYEFQSRLNGQGSNYSRCLFRNGTGFNSNRWLLANGSSVICRHDVGGMLQDAAEWSVNVGHYTSGVLHVEASTDAENWTEVGQLDQVGSVTGSVPEDLLPASEIYIRLSCSGRDEATESPAPGSLQVYGYTYSATLDGDVDDCRGNTQFIELIQPNDGYVISSLSEARPGENAMGIRIAGAEPDRLAWRVVVEPANGPPAESTGALRDLVDGQDMRIPYTVERVGAHVLTVSISDPAKPEPVFVARTQFTVPDLYAADFGYSIGDGLWWCESPYKISRERPAPRDRRPAVELSAARNEYEPVQLVVRPASDLTDLMATVTDLEGPRGGTIPADAITIDRVAYVNVQVPTDPTGCEGLWPDPLPPLTEPFDAEAGVNHPLWITVKVPKGVPAGRYEGDVRLTADGYEETVPLRLRVYDFDLPDETHVESGFGLSSGPLRQYHNLDTNEEVREVYDLYLRNFADHRISPYNPTPFDPIRVTFSGIDWRRYRL